MKRSKDEIASELAHQQRLLQELHRRRRVLEIQVVQQGINSPPQIITELDSLTEQIQRREVEITLLETQAAEDELSLAEAEYRTLVAEAWGTDLGRPTVLGGAKLELSRLRLGLNSERAREIEQSVRIKLAEEAFANLDTHLIEFLPMRTAEQSQSTTFSEISRLTEPATLTRRMRSFAALMSGAEAAREAIRAEKVKEFLQDIVPGHDDPREIAIRSIGRAIRLDLATALRLSLAVLPPKFPLDLHAFGEILLNINRVWNYQEDHALFTSFIEQLAQEIQIH